MPYGTLLAALALLPGWMAALGPWIKLGGFWSFGLALLGPVGALGALSYRDCALR